MSETKWTAGRWRAGRRDMVTLSGDESSPYYKNVYVSDPRGGTHQGHERPLIVGRGQGDEAECRANAALIAAAPDLYEALTALDKLYAHAWDLVEPSGAVFFNPSTVATFEKLHEAASAALARARGETP